MKQPTVSESPAPAGVPAGATNVLVDAVQRLSMARTIEQVQEIVRSAARRLTGADGATFILRDGEECFYADEDAVSPLWKGSRFPLEDCISGWAMLNGRAAAIEDIYADDRVPHEAYRPTFVKSLAMVPIRSRDPIGAIGNYWAERHRPTETELDLLQALADSTAVAMENVKLWTELEDRVRERTADLRALSEQQEKLLNSLSHEVRNPLTAAQLFIEEVEEMGGGPPDALLNARRCITDALRIVDGQLQVAKQDSGRQLKPLHEPVDVTELLSVLYGVGRALRRTNEVEMVIAGDDAMPIVRTDPHLLLQILRNLLGNALKFTDAGTVSVRAAHHPERNEVSFTVADTGVGIAPEDRERIFQEFAQVEGVQRGRPRGSGLGLALSAELADALGGRLDVDSRPGEGSAFTLTLPVR